MNGASFRGINFHLTSVEHETGIRHAVHEYIGDTEAGVTLIGQVATKIPVSGYLLGSEANYLKKMLLQACRNKEPGSLYHPSYGILSVVCVSAHFKENFHETGIIYFDAEFLKKKPVKPVILEEIVDAATTADEYITSQMALFAETFSILALPGYLADMVVENLEQVASFIVSSSGIGVFHSSANKLISAYGTGQDALRKLAESPKKLAQSIQDSISMEVSPIVNARLMECPVAGPIADLTKGLVVANLVKSGHKKIALAAIENMLNSTTNINEYETLGQLKASVDSQPTFVIPEKYRGTPAVIAAVEMSIPLGDLLEHTEGALAI